MADILITEPEEVTVWYTTNGAKMMAALGVKSGDTVIDFGCGPGRYTVPLSHAVGPNGRVLAFERDRETVTELQGTLATSETSDVVTLLHADTDGLDLLATVPDKTADSCFLFDVLQFIPDQEALFASFCRVLQPGGHIQIYPALIPHPGLVDINSAITTLDKLGFAHTDTRMFRMMHNVHMIYDTVFSFCRNHPDR